MQAPDNVQFRNADIERLPGFSDNFLDRELKAIGIAFLREKEQNWQERMQ